MPAGDHVGLGLSAKAIAAPATKHVTKKSGKLNLPRVRAKQEEIRNRITDFGEGMKSCP